MALQKQAIPINFSSGLDLKTDPKQLQLGKFLKLKNSVFTKAGLLQKRYGYQLLTGLPDTTSTYVTTFNGNLTAIGDNLQAYSTANSSWVNKGNIRPIKMHTLPLYRSTTNQSQADSAVAPNGLVCTAFTDNIPDGLGGTTQSIKYVVADSVTGQNIVAPTVIPPGAGTVSKSPKVFVIGNHFIVVFTNNIGGGDHLQFLAINTTNPAIVSAPVDISSQYASNVAGNFDGVVANNNLYLAWNGSDGGGAVRMTYIDSSLTQHSTVVYAGRIATIMSLCADTSGSTAVVYASFYNSATNLAFTLAVSQDLSPVLAPTSISTGTVLLNLASVATSGVATVMYEVQNTYSYDLALYSNYINKKTVTQSGTVSAVSLVVRSVGLATKAFIIAGTIYVGVAYGSVYQPTYFVVDSNGHVIMKLAYSNGSGYAHTGITNVTVTDSMAQFAYLYKDLIESVNKDQGTASANTPAIYSQTGINLATVTVTTEGVNASEIGGNLNLSGGFLWMYDGYVPVEQGFHLWPDAVEVTTSTTGGLLTAQQYYYQVTYEWADNQGNVFRSAPSLPISVTTTGATSSNTINVPTLRLTYKTVNPVKIVIYRWSVAQQNFYQVTSTQSPVLNSTTVDSVSFVDTLADSAILGRPLIYTTGGVIENIAAPAVDTMTLFKSRLFLIDAEDKNLLWYSKQVIENTPVELSDLFTIYVAPTAGAQGSTGPMTALSALDDKLILFKRDAIYYVTGTGPDNTGANNDFSEPTFITSTVGCTNQASIVFIPQGLIFQSDKGLWLLGRDLSTTYIGAQVEDFNDAVVQSAVNVPGTNQVRFTLDTGITLMYDYYYAQWGTFVNVPAVSSTLYQNLHTFINSRGQVFQEAPGTYNDGGRPVLMSFTTGWINVAGLQGYQRVYYFYMLGNYISPHKLNIQLSYDYAEAPIYSATAMPDNYTPNYGGLALWGSGESYGGPGNIEQERIFLQQQKCQAFQITLNEVYDGTLGQAAGAGFTMSGIDIVVGQKSGYPKLKPSRSFG